LGYKHPHRDKLFVIPFFFYQKLQTFHSQTKDLKVIQRKIHKVRCFIKVSFVPIGFLSQLQCAITQIIITQNNSNSEVLCCAWKHGVYFILKVNKDWLRFKVFMDEVKQRTNIEVFDSPKEKDPLFSTHNYFHN
jgi:hypothetical protein